AAGFAGFIQKRAGTRENLLRLSARKNHTDFGSADRLSASRRLLKGKLRLLEPLSPSIDTRSGLGAPVTLAHCRIKVCPKQLAESGVARDRGALRIVRHCNSDRQHLHQGFKLTDPLLQLLVQNAYLVLGRDLPADVGSCPEPPCDIALRIEYWNRSRQEPAIFAILRQQRERVFPQFPRLAATFQSIVNPIDMLRVLNFAPAEVLQFLGAESRVLIPAVVVPEDGTVGVSHPRQLGYGVRQCAELRLTLAEFHGSFFDSPLELGIDTLQHPRLAVKIRKHAHLRTQDLGHDRHLDIVDCAPSITVDLVRISEVNAGDEDD